MMRSIRAAVGLVAGMAVIAAGSTVLIPADEAQHRGVVRILLFTCLSGTGWLISRGRGRSAWLLAAGSLAAALPFMVSGSEPLALFDTLLGLILLSGGLGMMISRAVSPRSLPGHNRGGESRGSPTPPPNEGEPNTMKHPLLTVVALLVPAVVLAQAPAPAPEAAPASAPAAAPAPQPAPPPAPEVKNFEFLVGDWIHDETWSAAAAGAEGRAKAVSRGQMILGDHVLQIIYKANTSMNGTVDARGQLRYDVEAKVYVFDWATSLGTAFHMEGALEGKALVLHGQRMIAGQPRREKMTLSPQEDGSITQKIEVGGADGAFVSAMESTIRPKQAPAPAS